MPRKSAAIRLEGKVLESLPNETFKVQLPNKHVIEAYVSGRMRMHFIRILPGDIVQVEVGPYDIARGRIVYRGRGMEKPEESNAKGDEQ
jgi:translation initiation factor IF-1